MLLFYAVFCVWGLTLCSKGNFDRFLWQLFIRKTPSSWCWAPLRHSALVACFLRQSLLHLQVFKITEAFFMNVLLHRHYEVFPKLDRVGEAHTWATLKKSGHKNITWDYIALHENTHTHTHTDRGLSSNILSRTGRGRFPPWTYWESENVGGRKVRSLCRPLYCRSTLGCI